MPTLYDTNFYAITAAPELVYHEVPKKVSTLKLSEKSGVPRMRFEKHLNGNFDLNMPISMDNS
jgi:predicted DNA binding protein